MSKQQNHVLAVGVLCVLMLASPQKSVHAQQEQTAVKQSEAATPVTLTFSPKVGDSIRYQGTLKLVFEGGEILFEQSNKHIVKEVKDSKEVTVRIEDEGAMMTMNGETNALPLGSPTTVTTNQYNQILTFKPERDDNPNLAVSTQHLLALTNSIIFPSKPVKPGDSWTTEVDNPQVKDKKVIIKTTYLGEDKAEGAAVWKVKQTVEADTQLKDNKLTAETTALLDAATGQLIEAKQSVQGMPGPTGAISWTGTLARVKADKPDAEKSDKATAKPATP